MGMCFRFLLLHLLLPPLKVQWWETKWFVFAHDISALNSGSILNWTRLFTLNLIFENIYALILLQFLILNISDIPCITHGNTRYELHNIFHHCAPKMWKWNLMRCKYVLRPVFRASILISFNISLRPDICMSKQHMAHTAARGTFRQGISIKINSRMYSRPSCGTLSRSRRWRCRQECQVKLGMLAPLFGTYHAVAVSFRTRLHLGPRLSGGALWRTPEKWEKAGCGGQSGTKLCHLTGSSKSQK